MRSRVIPCLLFRWTGSPLSMSVLFSRAAFLEKNSDWYLSCVVFLKGFSSCEFSFLTVGMGTLLPSPCPGQTKGAGLGHLRSSLGTSVCLPATSYCPSAPSLLTVSQPALLGTVSRGDFLLLTQLKTFRV